MSLRSICYRKSKQQMIRTEANIHTFTSYKGIWITMDIPGGPRLEAIRGPLQLYTQIQMHAQNNLCTYAFLNDLFTLYRHMVCIVFT